MLGDFEVRRRFLATPSIKAFLLLRISSSYSLLIFFSVFLRSSVDIFEEAFISIDFLLF